MSEDSSELILVTSNNCPGCEEIKRQLGTPEIKQVLKERFGKDNYRELKVEEDKFAAQILVSLQAFETPTLALHKVEHGTRKVCRVTDDLTIAECGPLVDLPEE